MTTATGYTCSGCGQMHDTWPALTFKAPDHYYNLSSADKDRIAELNSDFCIIRHEEQTDRFIRGTLTQQVIDHCENLDYGLWVSLSEKSFKDYCDNYDNEHHETTYFGWLCNDIPGYTFNKGIPTTVITKTGNQRPEIVPHKDFDHPFVTDYYNGIFKLVAEKRIRAMMQGTQEIAAPALSKKTVKK